MVLSKNITNLHIKTSKEIIKTKKEVRYSILKVISKYVLPKICPDIIKDSAPQLFFQNAEIEFNTTEKLIIISKKFQLQ